MESDSLLSVLRGRLARRLSTVLLAAAFLLTAGGDLLGQSACAHHDAADRAEAPAAHAAAGHHDHHAGAAESARPSGERHGGHDSPCTCIGTCHLTAATPLAPLGAVIPAPATVLLDGGIAPSAERVGLARILLRLLPFANGPPRLA